MSAAMLPVTACYRPSVPTSPDQTHLSDHQFAVRADISSWGLIYYYAWERDAAPYITGRFEGRLLLNAILTSAARITTTRAAKPA